MRGSRVPQQVNKEVGHEITENLRLGELVESPGRDKRGPVLKPLLIDRGKLKGSEIRTQHVGPEKWLGFNWHSQPPQKR
jgi:hypothetical protein